MAVRTVKPVTLTPRVLRLANTDSKQSGVKPTQSGGKPYGSVLLALALGGVAAIAVHWQRSGSNDLSQAQSEATTVRVARSGQAPVTDGADVASLTAYLDEQSRSLRVLREEVTRLQTRVQELEKAQPAANVATRARANANAAGNRETVSTPTIASLTALGEDFATAEQVLGRVDELALERLNLRHQAQQEGADRQAIRETLRGLPSDRDALREEFGDASYDRYLYASGRPNRLQVTSVLRGSVAANAGLQTGDILQSIDGQSIFTLGDLQRLVRGSSDGSVPIQVSRGSERIDALVTRGPLGVRTLGTSVDPTLP